MIFIKKTLKNIRFVTIPFRIYYAFKFYIPKIILIFKCSIKSKELSTFTYKLTNNNIEYLIHNLSIITNIPYEQIEHYYNEINADEELVRYAINKIRNSRYKSIKDARCDLGSRIAYYCIIRAIKPKVVVENGVEIGYTGIVLCNALIKNKAEGFFGKYFGFDIDPSAGLLISEELYRGTAHILIDESLKTLAEFNEPIDFYFSDGGRLASYEKEELKLLQSKISQNAIVVSNKINFSNALSQLAIKMHKRHIYFREEPLDHWYPGAHIGIMY